MLFTFLLVVQAIIAAVLVTVILMQKSEGGGLGMGGSPSGLMSARGAADFLTRATSVLATLFVTMSVALAILASSGRSAKIDPSLARAIPAAPALQPPAQRQPDSSPFAGAARNALAPAGNSAAPADNGAVPLAH